jgi:hypothetical protein
LQRKGEVDGPLNVSHPLVAQLDNISIKPGGTDGL